jgi:hypothetical protein
MFATKIPTPCAKNVAHFVAADPRADGGQRRVSLAAHAVSIDRRVAGVAMRLALPIGCFRGVSLALLENARGFFYRVALDHADPELAVTLAESASESDIAPEWKAWARFFNLPRMTLAPGQSPVVLDRRLGELVLGAVQPRKRGWPLKNRRSAISARRIAGPKGRVQSMFCGEREIVGAE